MSFQDEFNVLVKEVEAQGGVLLPDRCTGEALTFGNNQKALARTCNCGQETILMVADMNSDVLGLTTVCGFCDVVTEWPRFQEGMLSEPEEEQLDL